MKTSRANLQPRATMSSSTLVSWASSQSIAGDVFVVVGRGVVTAGPHDGADESLKLNFTPQRPLRVPTCALTALVAAAPPGLSGA